MTQTARLYGGSLYTVAREENLSRDLLEEMGMVKELFDQNRAYVQILQEPSIPREERIRMLDEAFGGRIRTYLLNFLKLLCENGLLGEFSGCFAEFKKRFYKDKGILQAEAVSARPLTEEETLALTARLERVTGRPVILRRRTEAELLGGMWVEIEGHRMEDTLRGRLTDVERMWTKWS